jgi:hypothetical protein
VLETTSNIFFRDIARKYPLFVTNLALTKYTSETPQHPPMVNVEIDLDTLTVHINNIEDSVITYPFSLLIPTITIKENGNATPILLDLLLDKNTEVASNAPKAESPKSIMELLKRDTLPVCYVKCGNRLLLYANNTGYVYDYEEFPKGRSLLLKSTKEEELVACLLSNKGD